MFILCCLVLMICCRFIVESNVATIYDQRQTGDLNVQIELKNLQVVALMNSELDDYTVNNVFLSLIFLLFFSSYRKYNIELNLRIYCIITGFHPIVNVTRTSGRDSEFCVGVIMKVIYCNVITFVCQNLIGIIVPAYK